MVNLTYRDVQPDDFDSLHAIVSDWDVVRQLGGWPWPPDPAFTRTRAKPYDGAHGAGFVWAVCAHDRLIGTLAVTGGGLGYMFAPSVHGRGVATKAVSDAIQHAFQTEPDLHALRATTWHDNPASARVLAKNGFVHWQTGYERSKARGLPTLSYAHRLSRARWDRLRSPAQ